MSNSGIIDSLFELLDLRKKSNGTKGTTSIESHIQQTTADLVKMYGCSDKMATWLNSIELGEIAGWIPIFDGIALDAKIVSAEIDDGYLTITTGAGQSRRHRRYVTDHHFGFVTEEMIVDYRTLWGELVSSMEWWFKQYNTAAITIAGLWIELDPDDRGSFCGIDVCSGDTNERFFGISGPSEAGCCLFIKALQQYGTLTIRDLISEIRKHQKFWQSRENALKAGSKGCQFQVGEYVRKVPTDPQSIFEDQESWACYKVIDVLTPEQQILFMGLSPQYIPNMVLITPELKKFVAFSGDYVTSPRATPVNKPRNRRNRG